MAILLSASVIIGVSIGGIGKIALLCLLCGDSFMKKKNFKAFAFRLKHLYSYMMILITFLVKKYFLKKYSNNFRFYLVSIYKMIAYCYDYKAYRFEVHLMITFSTNLLLSL